MNFNNEKNISVIRRKDLGNQAQRQTFGKCAVSIKTKFRENVQCYGQVMLQFFEESLQFVLENRKNIATRRK